MLLQSFFFLMQSYLLYMRYNRSAMSVFHPVLLSCMYLLQQMKLLKVMQLDLFIGKPIRGMKKHDA